MKTGNIISNNNYNKEYIDVDVTIRDKLQSKNLHMISSIF